jgi:hypothetical protein
MTYGEHAKETLKALELTDENAIFLRDWLCDGEYRYAALMFVAQKILETDRKARAIMIDMMLNMKITELEKYALTRIKELN